MVFVHVPPGHSSCEKVPFHSCPSTCITVAGLPLFIPNEELEHELRRCGKFVCGFQTLRTETCSVTEETGVYVPAGLFLCET